MMTARRNNSFGRKARLLALAGVVCGLFSAGVELRAQASASPQRGFSPGSSYAISDMEAISTTGGNLIFRVPLASLPPGRGGSPGAGVSLFYNSKLWDSYLSTYSDPLGNQNTRNHLTRSPEGGWRYGVRYDVKMDDRMAQYDDSTRPDCTSPEALFRWKLKVSFPDGSTHEFRPLDYPEHDALDGHYWVMPDGYERHPCRPSRLVTTDKVVYYSTDGTYLRLEFEHDADSTDWRNNPWTLHLPDGRRVTGGGPTQRLFDRNHNFTEIQELGPAAGGPATKVVDQLGRSILIEYGAGFDVITVKGTGGEELRWTVRWKGVAVNKTYVGGGDDGVVLSLAEPLTVVDRVELPPQAGALTYAFGYNGTNTCCALSEGWGELSSVTLPSGARADYRYALDAIHHTTWDAVLKNSPARKDLRYEREYDGASTPVTETWLYDIQEARSLITNPDGGVVREDILAGRGLSRRTESPDGTVVERRWLENRPHGVRAMPEGVNNYVKTEYTSIRDAAGALVKTAVKDYDYDKNGNVTRVREYDWVPYGDVARDALGAFGVPATAPLRREVVNEYHAQTPGAADSSTDDPDVYHRPTAPRWRSAVVSTEIGDGSRTFSRTEFVYDDPASTGNLLQQKSWNSHKGGVARPLTRPLGAGGADNFVSMSHQYDQYGNPTLSTDANGHRTRMTYDAVGGFAGLYPTRVEAAFGSPVQRTAVSEYDFHTGAVTRATDVDNGVSTSTAYDVFGRPVRVEEADGEVDAGGASVERHTTTEYSDALRRVVVRSDLNATADGRLVSVQHFDQLGRVRLSRTLEDASAESAADEGAGIKVQTRYGYGDAVADPHSYVLTSNPYRAATAAQAVGEATMGWTLTTTDKGGRVVRAETFAGAALPAPFASMAPSTATTGAVLTSYDADAVTVTDQADRLRRSITDALGRLVRLDEPARPNGTLGGYVSPAQPTAYTYDPLGNLTSVRQGGQLQNGQYAGGQTRSFTYSSLARLTSALNPEVCQEQPQGGCAPAAVTYEYDAAGNLKKKTDARGVVTAYSYDALGRVTSRSYTDGTPAVTYAYDDPEVPHSKGRLTSVGSSVSTYVYASYDARGRVRGSAQTTGGTTYVMTYEHDLAGNLVSERYPSGRVVRTEYDAAGRTAGVKDGATGSYYAGASPGDANNRLQYTAHGAVSAVRLGNGLWEHTSFNSRLQIQQIGLGISTIDSSRLRLTYGYGPAGSNSGNVRSQRVEGGGLDVTQEYDYDELNRLKTAEEKSGPTSNWRQVYSYDAYGNRTLAAGTTYPAHLNTMNNSPVSQVTNRLASPGYMYDSAGNLLCDPARPCGQLPPAPYYAYDAENRMKAAGGGFDAGGATYAYDGEGRRVRKAVAGGEETVFVYNMAGRLVAEYSNRPRFNGASYLTQDHLGSTRAVTDAEGRATSRHDYFPFGEEIGEGTGARTTQGYRQANGLRQKFTRQQRDSETGMDYFGARYYSSTGGRFTSADPYNIILEARATAEISPQKGAAQFTGYLVAPQQWNRYAYVANNPLIYVDPTGETLELVGDDRQRARAFERIRQMVGGRGADSLYVREENGRYFVESENGGALDASGKIGVIVNDVISSCTLVQFQVADGRMARIANGSTIDLADSGGGFTANFINRQTGNLYVQITVASNAGEMGESALASKGIVGDDGKRLRYTNEIFDAHEFGHAHFTIKNLSRFENSAAGWKFWRKGESPGDLKRQSNQWALGVENWARERRGLNKRTVHD